MDGMVGFMIQVHRNTDIFSLYKRWSIVVLQYFCVYLLQSDYIYALCCSDIDSLRGVLLLETGLITLRQGWRQQHRKYLRSNVTHEKVIQI